MRSAQSSFVSRRFEPWITGRVVSGSNLEAKHGLGGARERTPGVTVAILAQGTTSGDALCAALFCVPSVRTPGVVFGSSARFRMARDSAPMSSLTAILR